MTLFAPLQILHSLDTLPTPRWLIDGLLPEGYLVLLDGPSGVGKSLLAAALAAEVSRSEGHPFVTWFGPTDDLEDLAWPALQRHKYHEGSVFWQPFREELDDASQPNTIYRFLTELKDLLARRRHGLVVLDGIERLFPFLARTLPLIHRRFWNTLRTAAREHHCTLLVLRSNGLHQTKQMSSCSRVGAETTRFALTLAWHPHDPAQRLVTTVPHHSGPSSAQHLLDITPTGIVTWNPVEPDAHTRPGYAAIPAITPRRHGPQSFVKEIAAKLLDYLQGQPRPIQEVKEYLAALGYTETSIRKAVALCPLKAERRGNAWWYLVETGEQEVGHAVHASQHEGPLPPNQLTTQEPLPSPPRGEGPGVRGHLNAIYPSDPEALPPNQSTTHEPLLTTAH